MGPETPLTRIREIMGDRVPLYQLAARSTKPEAPLPPESLPGRIIV